MDYNYIKLHLRFWRLHKEVRFTPPEIALYFFLVAECNSLGWKNPFQHSNDTIYTSLSISEKTLIAARLKLQHAGLLAFEKGHKRYPTTYRLARHEELFSLDNTGLNSQPIREVAGQTRPNTLENVGSSLNEIYSVGNNTSRPYERAMAMPLVREKVDNGSCLDSTPATPIAPVECSADYSPLVDKPTFAHILRAGNYGHVDMETYRLQMLTTAQTKQVRRTPAAWHKWIINYLNNERQSGQLLLPSTSANGSPFSGLGNLRKKAGTQSFVL